MDLRGYLLTPSGTESVAPASTLDGKPIIVAQPYSPRDR
jgi:hypothetical protein